MQGLRKKSAWALAAFATAIAIWATGATAQTGTVPGPFTDAQATAGQDAFLQNCAACHGNNLAGSGEAPPLAGVSFMASWGARTTQDLFNEIKLGMPLGNPNTLSPDTYASIVAFILKVNGAEAGTAEFAPGGANVRISTVATGKVPADLLQNLNRAAAGAGRGATASAGGRNGNAGGGARAGGRRGAAPRTGLTVTGTVTWKYAPVTDQILLNPPDIDWLMHYQNYAGWSHSPLKTINTQNVANLQLRWVWSMDDGERQQITPIVHDGVMFVTANQTNKVQALNARSGDLVWENNLGPVLSNVEDPTRSTALYGNLFFYGDTDGTLYALNALNGKIVWQRPISTYIGKIAAGNDKIDNMMVIHGKIIIGLTRCDDATEEDHCWIGAFDANDGKLLWKFITVADKGMPGGDTWGNIPNDRRAGADAWITGTYDPVLNLTYWGTGQAKSPRQDSQTLRSDALYTNTTLALDPDTGKLKWYHQDAPDNGLDLDEVYEKVLVDEGDQKTLITVGKKGIMWKLDRITGKFLDYRPTVFQNVFTSIDRKTGRATYRPDILSTKSDRTVASSCPAASGGHDWPNTSYDPEDDLMVLPLDQICSMSGGNFEMPGSDGNLGRVSAYEAKTFKPVWTFQQRAPFLTGVMTTAGGVGFVGDWDRTFRAFNVKTGKTLWKTRLGTTAQGYITTYFDDGEQFVAVATGYNGGSPEARPTPMLSGELNRPMTGHAVYVFALPPQVVRP